MAMALRRARGSATIASPQSYGTLRVLWASVAQESAPSNPAVKCRCADDAAAKSPNAPSTCTHAPCRWAASIASPKGSKPPECTLPAWSRTMVGPSDPAPSATDSASGTRRPSASASTTSGAPRPRYRSARSMLSCRSPPTITRTRGASVRPCLPTSQPTRRNVSSRAAARQVKLDIVAPVAKPTALPAGSPSRSSSQLLATSSTAEYAGVTSRMPAFWSHALVSQSAASAAGWLPPMTIP